jgi:cytosine/adenosine deaminase-related metal-dependent hydrolase
MAAMDVTLELQAERLLLAPEWMMVPEGMRQGLAAVVADGSFRAVGPVADLAAQWRMQPVHLPDRLMMPGLIDAHTHLTQTFGKALAFGEPSEIFKRIWVPMEGCLGEREVYLAAKLGALEALRGGFTTVSDAGTRSQGNASVIAEATRAAGLRCVLGFICNDFPDAPVPGDRLAILGEARAHLERFAADPLVHPSLAISIPEVASDDLLRAVADLSQEADCPFQLHANEHLAAVERSIVQRGLRPIEHLHAAGALRPQTLLAHATLVTPYELTLLRDSGAAFTYNPVASSWKGNAVAPALQMAELGIRFGLGTDGTRADAFRLLDAAETAQRLAYGLGSGDSSCGAGALWLAHGTRGGADALRLGARTGAIAAGLAADFLLVDLGVPEFMPSFDLPWELVRYGNRDQIKAVFVAGALRLWEGRPVDWDARTLLDEVREAARKVVAQAPIRRVHGTSTAYLEARGRGGAAAGATRA